MRAFLKNALVGGFITHPAKAPDTLCVLLRSAAAYTFLRHDIKKKVQHENVLRALFVLMTRHDFQFMLLRTVTGDMDGSAKDIFYERFDSAKMHGAMGNGQDEASILTGMNRICVF